MMTNLLVVLFMFMIFEVDVFLLLYIKISGWIFILFICFEWKNMGWISKLGTNLGHLGFKKTNYIYKK